ncbi:Na+/H+ antiporter subunit E [Fusibacter sp. JL216-2]|uniref:Na+/H+ antiporter subunit E n=1 Tax=Fusibacter sp. JL216-2 TaxID=3071453 RepID=UPI003D33D784
MAKKWGNRFIKYIVLLLFWLVLSGTFDARVLITGLFAAAVVLLASEYSLKKFESSHVFIRYHYHILWFFGIVLIEIFLAAYQHIQRVLAGEDRSVIFELDLSVEDEFAIALIANAITLTPGTLTMQVHDQTLTILGFADSIEEVDEIKRVVIEKYQKPFLGGGH